MERSLLNHYGLRIIKKCISQGKNENNNDHDDNSGDDDDDDDDDDKVNSKIIIFRVARVMLVHGSQVTFHSLS